MNVPDTSHCEAHLVEARQGDSIIDFTVRVTINETLLAMIRQPERYQLVVLRQIINDMSEHLFQVARDEQKLVDLWQRRTVRRMP